jgi:hypothetical protein
MVFLHCIHPEKQPEPKVFDVPRKLAEVLRRRMEKAGWHVRIEEG